MLRLEDAYLLRLFYCILCKKFSNNQEIFTGRMPQEVALTIGDILCIDHSSVRKNVFNKEPTITFVTRILKACDLGYDTAEDFILRETKSSLYTRYVEKINDNVNRRVAQIIATSTGVADEGKSIVSAKGYNKEDIRSFIHPLSEKVLSVLRRNSVCDVNIDALYNSLEAHQLMIYNFVHSIQFNGISEPQHTEKVTIELDISRYLIQNSKRKVSTSKHLKESGLTSDDKSYLIFGGPGAGKTTTLKRLINRMVSKRSTNQLQRKVPILIRFIELDNNENLLCKIAKILGLVYETKSEKHIIGIRKNETTNEYEQVFQTEEKNFIDGIEIQYFLPQFLSDANIILFLDGIDEVRASLKEVVWKDLKEFMKHKVSGTKVILTCRSGERNTSNLGFNECEVLGLTDKQISHIAQIWLGKDNLFLAKLKMVNYRDLADRPLFLVHLLMTFQEEEDLPVNALSVYERMITLVLWKWDRERENIKRVSVYGTKFDTYQKHKFIKELAFNLLYKIKEKRFTSHHLKEIYLDIYTRYEGLLENEAEVVVREIESHNGLIVKTGLELFEFSHLSLMEYLCAEYLSKIQINKKTFLRYALEYPAPLGIAIALSPEPSNWLASLIFHLKKTNGDKTTIDYNYYLQGCFNIIINRAMTEGADFEYSFDLAYSLFMLLDKMVIPSLEETVARLIEFSVAVKRSLINIINLYNEEDSKIQNEGTKFAVFKLKCVPQIELSNIEIIPERLIISKKIVKLLDN